MRCNCWLNYQLPLTGAATQQTRAVLRRTRERKIVDATRALFDERGMQDARIDRIARRVGINKALIYRHFACKEELFVLTITSYLAEINALLQAVDEQTSDPSERLRRGFEAFAEYGIEHPAFLDGALSLLRQPAEDLRAQVSDAVWLRLGRGMGACIGWLADVLRDLGVSEPDLRANRPLPPSDRGPASRPLRRGGAQDRAGRGGVLSCQRRGSAGRMRAARPRWSRGRLMPPASGGNRPLARAGAPPASLSGPTRRSGCTAIRSASRLPARGRCWCCCTGSHRPRMPGAR